MNDPIVSRGEPALPQLSVGRLAQRERKEEQVEAQRAKIPAFLSSTATPGLRKRVADRLYTSAKQVRPEQAPTYLRRPYTLAEVERGDWFRGLERAEDLSPKYKEAWVAIEQLKRQADDLDKTLSLLNQQLAALNQQAAAAEKLHRLTQAQREKIENLRQQIQAAQAHATEQYHKMLTQLPRLQEQIEQARAQNWQARDNMAYLYDQMLKLQIEGQKPSRQRAEEGLATIAKQHERAMQTLIEQVKGLNEEIDLDQLMRTLTDLQRETKELIPEVKQAAEAEEVSAVLREEIRAQHHGRLKMLQQQFVQMGQSLQLIDPRVLPDLAEERAQIIAEIKRLEQLAEGLATGALRAENFAKTWNQALDEASALRRFANKVELRLSDYKAQNVVSRRWPWSRQSSAMRAAEVAKTFEGFPGYGLAVELGRAFAKQRVTHQKQHEVAAFSDYFIDGFLHGLGKEGVEGFLPGLPKGWQHDPTQWKAVGEQIAQLSSGRRAEILERVEHAQRNAIWKRLLNEYPHLLQAGDAALVQAAPTSANLEKFLKLLRERLAPLARGTAAEKEAFQQFTLYLNNLEQLKQLRRDPRLFSLALASAAWQQAQRNVQQARAFFVANVHALNRLHECALRQLGDLQRRLRDLHQGHPPSWVHCREAVSHALFASADGVSLNASTLPAAAARDRIVELLFSKTEMQRFVLSLGIDFATLDEQQIEKAVRAAIADLLAPSAQFAKKVKQHQELALQETSTLRKQYQIKQTEIEREAAQLVQMVAPFLDHPKPEAKQLSAYAERLILDRHYYLARGLKAAEAAELVERERRNSAAQFLRQRQLSDGRIYQARQHWLKEVK